MKVALIGASGNVGSFVLKELLNRGHEVTAIARHPEKIKISGTSLHHFKGDILTGDVSKMVEDHDAVISCYNPGWGNPEIYNLYLEGSQAILNGTIKAGITIFLVVGGAGSLEVSPGVQLVDTPQIPDSWKPGPLAARDFLNIIKNEQKLEWTFLSPALKLEPGERTGKFRLGTDQLVTDEKGESRISVPDIAVALINELEEPRYVKRRFTVAY